MGSVLLSMAGTPIATLIHDGLQSYQFWFSVATAVSIGLQQIPPAFELLTQAHFLPLQLTQQGLRLGDSAADVGLGASGAATSSASLCGGAPSSRLTSSLARETAALRLDHGIRSSPPLRVQKRQRNMHANVETTWIAY